MDREIQYFECQCGHAPCRFVIVFREGRLTKEWKTSWDPELYLTSFLPSHTWYRRIWYAIKYVFGYKCIYGHFGETMIKPEDSLRLRGLFQKYEDAYEAHQKEVSKVKMDKKLIRGDPA